MCRVPHDSFGHDFEDRLCKCNLCAPLLLQFPVIKGQDKDAVEKGNVRIYISTAN